MSGWVTAEQWALGVSLALEKALEERCLRLGRDRGPVCAYCDEPMAGILDGLASGRVSFGATDDGVVFHDDRVPVCLGHFETRPTTRSF